jgi:predicted nucleic acid-binding protein
MSSNAERWACDTSVAIASLDPSHEAHAPCRQALVTLRPALAGHASFETYSVLTRLPVALRLSAAQARRVLTAAFPEPCWLDAATAGDLLAQVAERGIVGGAVYDALVGRAAAADDRTLLTRDRRAERTYRLLDVDYQLVG